MRIVRSRFFLSEPCVFLSFCYKIYSILLFDLFYFSLPESFSVCLEFLDISARNDFYTALDRITAPEYIFKNLLGIRISNKGNSLLTKRNFGGYSATVIALMSIHKKSVCNRTADSRLGSYFAKALYCEFLGRKVRQNLE